LPEVPENLGFGVMACWSVEKKGINTFVITPVVQLVAPKSHLSMTKGDNPKLADQ
jgi:hypothetical protein